MLLLKMHKIKIKNKVALGNRNDTIHQRNDRILGYIAMSIPAGRVLNIGYTLTRYYALRYPVGIIGAGEIANDVLNPSMPATSKTGMIYNMYDQYDNLLKSFLGE